MRISLKEIFWIFTKVGSVLLGGGYVILPLLQSETVEKRKWVTSEELLDYYAISQCIPGITAADVSMFVGYKLRGKWGAWAAGLGVISAPFFTIVCLAVILTKLVNSTIVQSIFWGVGIGVIVLLTLSVREMWSKSIVDKFSLFLFLLVFLLTVFLDYSPVIIVLGSVIVGIFQQAIKRNYEKKWRIDD